MQSMTVLDAAQQEERSTRFETDFGETAAEASTAAADHGQAPVPTLSLQDIDAAIDREMASPQVSPLTVIGRGYIPASAVWLILHSDHVQRLWMWPEEEVPVCRRVGNRRAAGLRMRKGRLHKHHSSSHL